MQVSIDFETRSKVDITKRGLFNYASDDSTQIICCAISEVGDNPTHLYISDEFIDHYYTATVINNSGDLPLITEEDFLNMVIRSETVFAFNVAFEIEIWHQVGVKRMGWPKIGLENWKCKQAMARYAALPGHLDGVGMALDLIEKKDPKGKALIRKLCCPRKPTKNNPAIWNDDPMLFYELFDYCIQDVKTEKGI